MAKQRLEGDFRESIKKHDNAWYLKLQTFPGAYTENPADFLVLTPKYRYLIECKQTTGKRFDFARLTQKAGLIKFHEAHDNNKAYVLISFWKSRKIRSFFYLIPIDIMIQFSAYIPKKSANESEFNQYLSEYRVDIDTIYKQFV